jgi:hypothetical protein
MLTEDPTTAHPITDNFDTEPNAFRPNVEQPLASRTYERIESVLPVCAQSRAEQFLPNLAKFLKLTVEPKKALSCIDRLPC